MHDATLLYSYYSIFNSYYKDTKQVLREVTIVKENGYNDVVAEYRGSYYTAVFNPFVGCYFVDDKYGYIGDCKKSR